MEKESKQILVMEELITPMVEIHNLMMTILRVQFKTKEEDLRESQIEEDNKRIISNSNKWSIRIGKDHQIYQLHSNQTLIFKHSHSKF